MTRSQPRKRHLEAAKSKWGTEDEIAFLRQGENFVYESQLEGRAVILRLTEPQHRTYEELCAELDWMNYLHESNLQIAAPIASCEGRLVEQIEVGGDHRFYASLFEKAKGAPLKEKEDFSLDVMRSWGMYLGRMHSLTKNYNPKPGTSRRALWSEDAGLKVAIRGLEEHDEIPYQRFFELREWLDGLDTDPDCFGLVHADMHHGNFFVNQGLLTAFDFDDSTYHWFAYDLAVPLMNLLSMSEENFFDIPYQKLRDSYLAGYSDFNSLDQKWLDRIDLFLKYRITTVYHWVKAGMKDNFFDDKALPWCQKVLPWSKTQLAPALVFS